MFTVWCRIVHSEANEIEMAYCVGPLNKLNMKIESDISSSIPH